MPGPAIMDDCEPRGLEYKIPSTLGTGIVFKTCSSFDFGFRVTTPSSRDDDNPAFSKRKCPTHHYFHIFPAPPIYARKVPEG